MQIGTLDAGSAYAHPCAVGRQITRRRGLLEAKIAYRMQANGAHRGRWPDHLGICANTEYEILRWIRRRNLAPAHPHRRKSTPACLPVAKSPTRIDITPRLCNTRPHG